MKALNNQIARARVGRIGVHGGIEVYVTCAVEL
jgi:hypothetical protein